MNLTEDQIRTLQHSLGLTSKPYEYRNHFYTHDGDPQIMPLVKSGHMERGSNGCDRRGRYFHVTDKGRRAAWDHMPPFKAYEITIDGFGEGSSIIHALNAGKAKYEAFLSASDVIEGLNINQFRARRCPEMDRNSPSEFRSREGEG